jgi:ABC-type sugar transport system ATPase subunit
MTEIALLGITNRILHGIDLHIKSGEFMVMTGPSGAGKTTLLNVIAGLANYSGRVFFDGKPVDKVPTFRRGLGYVFQDPMLFPHLTVEANLDLALRAIRNHSKKTSDRARALLATLGIEHLRERLPRYLSAGERQRAALARTLASGPRVLLLDEPFANLDSMTAGHLRKELRLIHDRLKITTVLVTHHLDEAEEVGGRIVKINKGAI